MNNILSKEEMDTLLSESVTGSEAQGPVLSKVVSNYDFKMSFNSLPDQLTADLSDKMNSFGESVRNYFATNMKYEFVIRLASIDKLLFSEYMLTIPQPSSLFVIGSSDPTIKLVLELDPRFIVSAVSRMLGGEISEVVQSRPVTQLEQNIFKKVVNHLTSELEAAIRNYVNIKLGIEKYTNEGKKLVSHPAEEKMITSVFEISYEQVQYQLRVSIPNFIFNDAIKEQNKFKSAKEAQDILKPMKNACLEQNLLETGIDVLAILGTSRASVKELIDLRPGDILRTDTNVNTEINLKIGKQLELSGLPGISNGKLAINVTRIFKSQKNKINKKCI